MQVVSVEAAASSAPLTLSGALSVAHVQELWELARTWCAGASAGPFVVDCSGLERIDTSALQVLLALKRALQERDVTLTLTHVSEKIVQSFRAAAVLEEMCG